MYAPSASLDERRPRLASWLSQFSFRARVSALAAAAVAIAIALAAVLSYVAVSHQLTGQVNRSLSTDAASLRRNVPPAELRDGVLIVPRRAYDDIAQTEQNDEDIVQFIDSTGTIYPIASDVGLGEAVPPDSNAPPTIPRSAADRRVAEEAAAGSYAEIVHDIRTKGRSYRVMTVALGPVTDEATGTNVGGVAVQLAHSLADTNSTLTQLRVVMTLVGLFGVALAVGLGLAVAGATIGPVKRLTAAAEHVAATQDLEARIDEDGDDELARLAHAFNGMLGALAASRLQQAQLISDAGHELRTPLTSLRTNIEVLMRVRDLPEADRNELLADVQAQLDELTTLVGDVVDMARQDEVQPDPTEVRLDLLVERAVERARRRNSRLVFDTDLDTGSVRGQPSLLERAVLNVLDNAAKFSPDGGTVEVRLRRADRWRLEIRDHGPGIAPEDRDRIFDRFYRAPSARSLPGSGLGLAIVRQVVTNHQGTVSAEPAAGGGTLVRIELPIVTEEEPDVELPPPEAPPAPGEPGPAGAGPGWGPALPEPSVPGGDEVRASITSDR